MADCITKLTEARLALHSLMTTGQTVSIATSGGDAQTFSRANVGELRHYVRELEAECGETDASGLNPSRRGAIRFTG